MRTLVNLLGGLLNLVVTFAILIILGIVAFYVTVFVVSTGAGLAGYEDVSGDFVVLSAALLVVAALLGGIPLSRARSRPSEERVEPDTGFH